jgi:hypothetical protein
LFYQSDEKHRGGDQVSKKPGHAISRNLKRFKTGIV